jgi:hypothetical protein
MILRVKINAVDWFRRGIDADNSIVSLQMNPATLSQEERELIAKHLLDAGDAYDVVYDPQRIYETVPVGGHPGGDLVEVKDATKDSLVMTLREL